MTESWCDIPGYVGRYEVSDLGRVRSVSRLVPTSRRNGKIGTRRIKSKVLALHTWGAKYPGVVLVSDDGTKCRRMVHRLVAEVFVPNPGECEVVNHIDADTFNASAANLEWCDQSQNVRHSYATGRRAIGSSHHFSASRRNHLGHCIREVFE